MALQAFFHVFFFVFTTTITLGTLLLGYPLKFIFPDLWDVWCAYCKGLFGKILVNFAQNASPATAKIYSKEPFSASVLLQPNAIAIVNHQIYSDWIYLWFLLYCVNLHSSPIFVLKRSIMHVPVFGWGMQLFNFLFLNRNFEKDKDVILKNAEIMLKNKNPLWVMLFPEGTVYNEETYSRSCAFYTKQFKTDMPFKNLLAPRSKGLQTILKSYQNSKVKVLYDITLAYLPMPPLGHQQVESFYNLKKSFINREGPKEVRIHVRKVPVNMIPLADDEFEKWLYKFWEEKDIIYDKLVNNGLENELGAVRDVKLKSRFEILECFVVPALVVLLVRFLRRLW